MTARARRAAARLGRGAAWGLVGAARRLGVRTGARPGLNVVGYLRAETGMGEVPRAVLRALAGAGYPVAGVNLGPASWTRAEDRSVGHLEAPGHFHTSLLCVNADTLGEALARLGPLALLGRRRIGLWHWETERFPAAWRPAFRHLDEVWVSSAFVQRTVAAAAPVPVVNVGLPVNAAQPGAHSRAELGLPEGRLLFLYSCDARSALARKNPAGAVAAFRRAFPDGERAALVVKISNADADPAAVTALRAQLGKAGVVIDRFLDRGALSSLFARCDAYVSLHRSEGFGLTVAEAMALGKPAVVTAYGGTMEFTTPANSFLVGYRLAPVGPGAAPYPPDDRWAEPDLDHAAALLRQVTDQPEEAARRGERAAADIARDFSSAAVARRMVERLALPRGRR
jgi:glycosyltransferase involved in cell wall biosynthesis